MKINKDKIDLISEDSIVAFEQTIKNYAAVTKETIAIAMASENITIPVFKVMFPSTDCILCKSVDYDCDTCIYSLLHGDSFVVCLEQTNKNGLLLSLLNGTTNIDMVLRYLNLKVIYMYKLLKKYYEYK